MSAQTDLAFMERALFLAERGLGRTTPNPIVGAVVVSDTGVVQGQGAHLVAGGPHGEVVALESAGVRARGATLYCTLEPCCHVGRTGPCVERVVAAGVRRVVVATTDANPRVAGQGLAYLRAHGIEVREGIARAEAERQHAPFFTWVRRRRPFVIVKCASSRDGFVGHATRRVALTGAVAHRYFHRQRAWVDAIMVGAGTVLVDDPLLTARGAYRHRPLTRVVIDWRGRVPTTAQVFSTLSAGPVIMVVTREAYAERAGHFSELSQQGVIIEAFDAPDLVPVLERLAARPVVSLLVEGGPTLQDACFAAGLVDRVQRIVTPHVLGAGLRIAAGIAPAEAQATHRHIVQLGDDQLMESDVHRAD